MKHSSSVSYFFNIYFTFKLEKNDSTRKSWETTFKSKKRRILDSFKSRQDTTWIRPKSSRWIQASTKNPAHGRDGVIGFIRRTRRPELLAEADVSVQCFLGGDKRTRSHSLVLDRLDAEPANPTALVTFPDTQDISWGAFLCKAAGLAFNAVNFNRSSHFARWVLSVWAWNCHCMETNIENSFLYSALYFLFVFCKFILWRERSRRVKEVYVMWLW